MHNQQALSGGNTTGKLVIVLHGRGGHAQDMAGFVQHYLPDVRYVALQADNNTWYPSSFLEPRDHNEPYLSAALEAIQRTIKESGVEPDKLILLGFSQGACLAAEYAARNPQRYGGLIIFSGGLIGEQILPPNGSLDNTPVVMGCSHNDPHIPLSRFEQSAQALKDAGARVQIHTYPGYSHTITQEELALARDLIKGN